MQDNKKALVDVLRESCKNSYLRKISDPTPMLKGDQIVEGEEESDENLFQRSRTVIASRLKNKYSSKLKIQAETINQEIYLVSFMDLAGNKQKYMEEGNIFCCQQRQASLACRWSLEQSYLQLHSLKEKQELIISLNFDTLNISVHYEAIEFNKEIMYKIEAGKYKLLLRSSQPFQAKYLYNKLKDVHEKSRGKQLKLTALDSIQQFYHKKYATEEYFVENCQTGDILLFQDNHLSAKFQRFFTNSDFNHVGMIIKDVRYGILIFQSNSNGVSLTSWMSVIKYKWYLTIPRIVWRRLRFERDEHFNNEIESFIRKNIRAQYHIDMRIFTAQQSFIVQQDQLQNQAEAGQDNATGYFCSQLVATIYKNLELLTRDKNSPNYQPACRFYPKDFSQRSGRKLDKGTLSGEYDICFDRQILQLSYPSFYETK